MRAAVGTLALSISISISISISMGTGCARPEGPVVTDAVAHVDGIGLDASVVAFVAERDGVDEASARARAIETLQLVAAAREQRREAAGEPTEELTPTRRAQLLRAARARLWLRTDFEPPRGPDAIPNDDPLLVRARSTSAWVHPEIVRVCQIIVVPKGLEGDAARERAGDPTWLEGAQRIAASLHQRAALHAPAADAEACTLLGRVVSLSGQPTDEQYEVRYEKERGFDLDACAESGPDGTCRRPVLDATWTGVAAGVEAPALAAPFVTQFGVHVLVVRGTEPAREAGRPETEAFLREQVHAMWQQREFGEYLQRLQAKRAVRIATEPPPQ
jgi:hypothetical protein